MKTEGKKGKMFLGNIEIGNVDSWQLLSNLPAETISFSGVFDPREENAKALIEYIENNDIVKCTIYRDDGESIEADMKIYIEDGEVYAKPIDKEVRQWVKQTDEVHSNKGGCNQ